MLHLTFHFPDECTFTKIKGYDLPYVKRHAIMTLTSQTDFLLQN